MPRSKTKDLTPKAIRALAEDRVVFRCQKCGTSYLKQCGNFSKSQSPLYSGNNGYLTICKTCVDKMYQKYCEDLGDDDAALRRVALHLDLYWDPSLAKASKKISADRSRVSVYVSRSNLRVYAGKTYDDTLREEAGTAINSMEDLHAHNSELADIANNEPALPAITKDDVNHWGYGFKPEEYVWLNAKYDEIRSTSVIDTMTREELVKDFCIQKLLQNNALRDGNIELYNKLSTTSQKTLDNANLTPKVSDAADKAGEKPMGVMIQMFEKEDPIGETRPEWRDVDGIIKFITIYFIGHLCKMIGIKNRYAKMYEEEMDKYRAEVPDYSDQDDEEIFAHLINGDFDTEESTDHITDGDKDGS